MVFLSIVVATVLVGLISLVGIVFFVMKSDIHKFTFYFVSLASGTMSSVLTGAACFFQESGTGASGRW